MDFFFALLILATVLLIGMGWVLSKGGVTGDDIAAVYVICCLRIAVPVGWAVYSLIKLLG